MSKQRLQTCAMKKERQSPVRVAGGHCSSWKGERIRTASTVRESDQKVHGEISKDTKEKEFEASPDLLASSSESSQAFSIESLFPDSIDACFTLRRGTALKLRENVKSFDFVGQKRAEGLWREIINDSSSSDNNSDDDFEAPKKRKK